MPLTGRPRQALDSTSQAFVGNGTFHSAGKEAGTITAVRVITAAFIAILGLALVLQQAAADPAAHRVYLPTMAVNLGSLRQAGPTTPNGMISVVAQAGLSCKDGETMPVTGARVTVVTAQGSVIGMTDESGYALFGATGGPTLVQIEWPAGFFPCPDSRPVVELPAGMGTVKFVAIAGH